MTLTKEILRSIANIPDSRLDTYLPLLNATLPKYEINTEERVACFLAQVIHESGAFYYVKEIASGQAYEGRRDLGNVQKGDGVKFKGRGLIQTTGRSKYRDVSLFLFGDERLLTTPELLEQPQYALDSACYYWQVKKLNDICDKPDDWIIEHKGKNRSRFEWLTIKINGGLNGYLDRLQYYKRAIKAIKKGGINHPSQKSTSVSLNPRPPEWLDYQPQSK